MEQDKDGGPAFPMASGSLSFLEKRGMSLRDWFAGQALTGWYASFMEYKTFPLDKNLGKMAEFFYKTADAMLKERKNNGRN